MYTWFLKLGGPSKQVSSTLTLETLLLPETGGEWAQTPGQPLPGASGLEPQRSGWIQFPKKLTPFSSSVACEDSSVKRAGFSQFNFLFILR